MVCLCAGDSRTTFVTENTNTDRAPPDTRRRTPQRGACAVRRRHLHDAHGLPPARALRPRLPAGHGRRLGLDGPLARARRGSCNSYHRLLCAAHARAARVRHAREVIPRLPRFVWGLGRWRSRVAGSRQRRRRGSAPVARVAARSLRGHYFSISHGLRGIRVLLHIRGACFVFASVFPGSPRSSCPR